MLHTILLIAPESSAGQIADLLRRELDSSVEVAPNRRAGLAALRRGEYALVLLDEALAAADPDTADIIYQNAVSAPVLEMNFQLATAPRVLRQSRAAIARATHERAQARASVTASLQSELNASLAGILLESQLALRSAQPDQAPKLRHLVELAGDLRNRLREQVL
jgi:signal transduction histidine kinase